MNNLSKEGGDVNFDNGKKPLDLLNRILKMYPKSGATILDFFAGEDVIIVTRGENAVFNRVLKLPQNHKTINWCTA